MSLCLFVSLYVFVKNPITLVCLDTVIHHLSICFCWNTADLILCIFLCVLPTLPSNHLCVLSRFVETMSVGFWIYMMATATCCNYNAPPFSCMWIVCLCKKEWLFHLWALWWMDYNNTKWEGAIEAQRWSKGIEMKKDRENKYQIIDQLDWCDFPKINCFFV